ncbi:MAG: hypothetical protein VW397_07915, partial [Candidatus Margulisiibacteriota bacterium]
MSNLIIMESTGKSVITTLKDSNNWYYRIIKYEIGLVIQVEQIETFKKAPEDNTNISQLKDGFRYFDIKKKRAPSFAPRSL